MLLSDPQVWASLVTLTVLEIVLGIDNLVFISVSAARLPKGQQPAARRLGLLLALFTRIALLLGVTYVARLSEPLFEALGQTVSWRDLVLLSGGLFLLYKGTAEIHGTVEGGDEAALAGVARTFGAVVAQIAVLDIVFSFDSVITAVGMARDIPVMVAAIVIAIAVMLFAAGPVGAFIDRHPTVKMLAFAFLLLIGVALVADGLHFHIPRGYLYFAVGFSIFVESLNLWGAKRRRARAGVKAKT
ncbi:MAG: TerC family protein [Alphaproteobacteria bacterium]